MPLTTIVQAHAQQPAADGQQWLVPPLALFPHIPGVVGQDGQISEPITVNQEPARHRDADVLKITTSLMSPPNGGISATGIIAQEAVQCAVHIWNI